MRERVRRSRTLRWSVLCGTIIAVLCIDLSASSAEAAGPPQIPASWVTDVTATSANLRAEINPEGSNTHYRFEYVTEAAYQANLSAVPPREGFAGAAKAPPGTEAGVGSDTTPLAVSQHLGALAPLTAYRYRPVATNSATTIGPEHTLTTEAPTNVFALPDNRAWELVSPLDKGGGAIAAPEALFGGGAIQAAASGGALTYGSATSFGQATGAPPASQYLSRRGEGGWSTENVSAPLDSNTYGDHPDGVPYRLFSPDLGQALLYGGRPCRGAPGCPSPALPLAGSGAPGAFSTYYLRTNSSGAYSSLLTPADLAHSAVTPEHFQASFAAVTPELSHVVLSSCAALSANATEVPLGPGECDPKAQNLYEGSGGGLALLDLLPGATQGTPGATIAAPSGAVSTNGARVYWTDANGRLYLYEAGRGKAVDESGQAEFQLASNDGSVAFFLKAQHLYRYATQTEAASDLTPAGGVTGVLGASADGAWVYYQDGGGLQLWHSGTSTQVAAGAGAAAPSDFPPATGTSRVSQDGGHLAFLSSAELTGYDNTDAESGLPDTELYLYDAGAGSLTCASCNPTGERPRGSSTIPGAETNGTTTAYKPRVLSTDGRRLFFTSADRLVIADTDSRPDAYQWEAQGSGDCARAPGCVDLISSGRSTGGASFLDASENGADAFFLTDESLVSRDPGSIDAYDARIDGGLAEPQAPIPCVGDACQALPNPPEDPAPGTLVPNSGNPPLSIAKERAKHHKHRHKHRRRGKRGKHRHGRRR